MNFSRLFLKLMAPLLFASVVVVVVEDEVEDGKGLTRVIAGVGEAGSAFALFRFFFRME